MTTAQESANGHRVSPPPCSFPDSPEQTRSEDSTNNNFNPVPATPQAEPFPASAYHVPPSVFAPTPHAYRPFEVRDRPVIPTPLPDRCQFMFSDGRQCTMARSDIHPSLCVYHSDREEQLFGDPTYRRETRVLDFPELYSACRDLSTAAGVNRALGQVFRLLAQRRISRQEAATFAKLAQLLLQSIRAAHAEEDLARAEISAIHDELPGGCERNGVILSERSERRIPQQLSPLEKVPHLRSPQALSPANSPAPPPAPDVSPERPQARAASSKPFEMNTSAPPSRNSREMNTYKNAGVDPIQNQHLQNRSEKEFCSSGRPAGLP